ncbi:hypothetical protein ACFQ3L_09370 [Lacticaseibacillus jixianensis]|uniref:Uncharacterized protein n=1 Tax=Lacticaseibacillus jixianensis TaxID=2486012 RepID=A0ABW4BAF4_9LACO|nr:hypothetical protein [Lacticaseibacillus jixianensis]
MKPDDVRQTRLKKAEQIAPPLLDLDGQQYSTSYQFEPNPVERLLGESETVRADFDSKTTKADRLDYELAAACGLLSSILDIFWTKDFSLSMAHQVGTDDANKIVMKFAQRLGFHGDDLTKAIRFLERYKMPGDKATAAMGGGLQHHLRDFTHHPTLVGLFFSILAQFTGVVYGTDTDGNAFGERIDPAEGFVGQDFVQKISLGTLHWFLHLISDFDGSSNNAGKGTGIPGPILASLKELSALPFFVNLRKHDNAETKAFTVWLSKLFNGTAFKDSDGRPIRFDLRTEMGTTKLLLKQAGPVVLNEVLVRVAYSVRRLLTIIKELPVSEMKDLMQINPQTFLPFNNRAISRMLVVATGVFSAVDIGQAAIATRFGKQTSVKTFIAKVNIVGLGRFAVAVVRDYEYLHQDIQEMYTKYQEHVSVIHRPYIQVPILAQASLSARQQELLLSLEAQLIQADILTTNQTKQLPLKQEWYQTWHNAIAARMTLTASAEALLDDFQEEWHQSSSPTWLYALLMEAHDFKGYVPFSKENVKKYRGLHYSTKWLTAEFIPQLEARIPVNYERLIKTYERERHILNNRGKTVAVGAAVTAGLTVATAGTAYLFAPVIATAMLGSSFAGLSGVALTNASLAAFGGGSLATGGLGMAGGAALLATGGGAIGLASGGLMSATSLVFSDARTDTLGLMARLLTILSTVPDFEDRQGAIEQTDKNVLLMIERLEHDTTMLHEAPTDEIPVKERKQQEKISGRSLIYLRRAHAELNKMQSKKSKGDL